MFGRSMISHKKSNYLPSNGSNVIETWEDVSALQESWSLLATGWRLKCKLEKTVLKLSAWQNHRHFKAFTYISANRSSIGTKAWRYPHPAEPGPGQPLQLAVRVPPCGQPQKWPRPLKGRNVFSRFPTFDPFEGKILLFICDIMDLLNIHNWTYYTCTIVIHRFVWLR